MEVFKMEYVYRDEKIILSQKNRWLYTAQLPEFKRQISVYFADRKETAKGNVTILDIYLGLTHIAKIEFIRSSFADQTEKTEKKVLLFIKSLLEGLDFCNLTETVNAWAINKLQADITIIMAHTYTGIGISNGYTKTENGIKPLKHVPNRLFVSDF